MSTFFKGLKLEIYEVRIVTIGYETDRLFILLLILFLYAQNDLKNLFSL